jgi:N-acetylglucosaminyl-diphospho-decaprenol L-rhamnosyltransferase
VNAQASPSVLAVVLNYRTADLTLRAVEASLREMEGMAGAITVVDNDSADGSYERLLEAVQDNGWSRVRVLQSGKNGGYGAGNNFGIRHGLPDGSSPDYIYILNSDAFPEPGAIRCLVEHLESHPEAGFAGSRIHGDDGAYHQTAFRFPTVFSEFESSARTGPISWLLGRYVVSLPEPTKVQQVDWMAGASLLVRKRMLDQIGLFDERFFLYFEEPDLCLRARRAGWQAAYLPQSRVMHIGSVSTGMKHWKRKPAYWFDSRLWYFTKNHGVVYAALATLAYGAGAAIFGLRGLVGRRRSGPKDPFLRDLFTHALRCAWHRRLVGRPDHATDPSAA